jgi:hypothetical protein
MSDSRKVIGYGGVNAYMKIGDAVIDPRGVVVSRLDSGKSMLVKAQRLREKALRSRSSAGGGNPPEGDDGLDGDE